MATADTSRGGLPLDEFTERTPPGWKPGLEHYPLKLFMEKLKLWYAVVDRTDESKLGPLVAGRLKGGALSIALKVQVMDANGVMQSGAVALQDTGSTVATFFADGTPRAPYDGGFKVLLRQLQERYG